MTGQACRFCKFADSHELTNLISIISICFVYAAFDNDKPLVFRCHIGQSLPLKGKIPIVGAPQDHGKSAR
jgi:hypothetical protein